MTPAEHIAKAEDLAIQADDAYASGLDDHALSKGIRSLAHACIAIAVELGVPHTPATSAVPSAG